MAYLAVLSASEGRRAGFAATAGVALGLLLIGLASALGLAALVMAWPLAYETLRWCGVGYLLWLAWDGWRDAAADHPDDGSASYAVFFQRGLVTNLLNPKAALFYVTVLPGFLDPAAAQQAVFLTLVYVTIATAIHVAIVTMAGTARGFLTDPNRNRFVRRALSLLLAVIALWLAVSTGRA